jgi:hypothetical protein
LNRVRKHRTRDTGIVQHELHVCYPRHILLFHATHVLIYYSIG